MSDTVADGNVVLLVLALFILVPMFLPVLIAILYFFAGMFGIYKNDD